MNVLWRRGTEDKKKSWAFVIGVFLFLLACIVFAIVYNIMYPMPY